MKIIDITKYKNVYATGDIHGNIRSLSFFINEGKKMKDSFVIVCGDIGLGFSSPVAISNDLNRICPKLAKNGNAIGVFRGNHDDPSWFHEPEKMNEICLNKGVDGITRNEFVIIDDYTILKSRYGNILCVGGARSVDKSVRIEGFSWWKDEMVQDMPENFIEELGDMKIDYVCTHTGPSVAYPLENGGIMEAYAMYDSTLIEDCESERIKLSELWSKLTELGHNIKYWLYGHFHSHFERQVDKTCFICLDMFRTQCDFYKFKKIKEDVGKRNKSDIRSEEQPT